MPEIIRQSGLQHIDFWSLDVEGAELIVLQTMDWSIPVHYILVETWPGRNADYDKITKLLTGQGFANEGLKSTAFCVPGQDCAKNTLYVNTNYGQHVWADHIPAAPRAG
jgi:hypothetical protein